MRRCPKCGSDEFGDYWVKERKLQYRCRECNWKDEPRTPEMEALPFVKEVSVGQFGKYEYHIYDQYNHAAKYSRGYNNESDCRLDAQRDVNEYSKMNGYGNCKAIIWPAYTAVMGVIVEPNE